MAKAPKAAKKKQSGDKMPLGTQLILAASIVPLCAVFLPTLVLLTPLMLPTIAVLMFDRDQGKHLALAVGMLNFCGSLQGLGALWAQGQTFSDVWPVLGDPLIWMFSYAAAGMAWLVYISIPPIISTYYKAASEARIRILMEKQQKLIDAWGDDLREAANEVIAENKKKEAAGVGSGAGQTAARPGMTGVPGR